MEEIRTEAEEFRGELKKRSGISAEETYIKHTEQFLYSVGKKEEDTITDKDLLEHYNWLKDRGITKNSIHKRLSSLGAFIDWADSEPEAEKLRIELVEELGQ